MVFDLKSITKGKENRPPIIVVYGGEGLGKSTFASQAPEPIFIQTEDGLGEIDTSKFPLAESYDDVKQSLKSLYTDEHEYKTVVVDSVDWLEKLIRKHLVDEAEKNSIEDFGYGKGYIYVAEIFAEFLRRLDALRTEKKMAVIVIGHSHVKRFDDPMSDPYDRYMLNVHDKIKSQIYEWADIIGFANQEFTVKKEDTGHNSKASRGVATGGNMLYLKRTPAYDAKNRQGLPDAIPLDWGAFADALETARKL